MEIYRNSGANQTNPENSENRKMRQFTTHSRTSNLQGCSRLRVVLVLTRNNRERCMQGTAWMRSGNPNHENISGSSSVTDIIHPREARPPILLNTERNRLLGVPF